jgi:hypothetical protein
MSEDLYMTWDSESQKEEAYKATSNNLDSYAGIQKSTAHGWDWGRNKTSYIDIEPNRSIRSAFNRGDYNAFRPGEAVASKQKRLIAQCMTAYSKVGIIRNVIDLMSDFSIQGMTLVHPNKSVEKFYRKWWKEIGAIDRSERFCNYLYRTSNVVVRRRTAKISKSQERDLKRSLAADVKIEDLNFKNREIPWGYDFLNPLSIDVRQGSLQVGKPEYLMRLSNNSYNAIMNNSNKKSLPQDLYDRLKNGERTIPIDPKKVDFYFYKKDDWSVWADPMISSILDDIIMLEKMKLADIAALDGAISNVRLWTVGDLDHKIIPKAAVLNKLRDILASNVGGGTMDMVWGPELKFTESQSQVYRFLGSEKYQPVLTSIYAGLGIPPTLTGAATGGGYTNNYVSLKTLIERLEYGRDVLTAFWQKEIEIVQKAMGFRYPAEIHFDSIVLSDEAAEKNLLIQLADRDIISNETLLERFREIPNIEKTRIRREGKERELVDHMPSKASPYHNPQHKEDVAKIGLTKDMVDAEEYLESLNLPYNEDYDTSNVSKTPNNNFSPKEGPGRPDFSKDSSKRKQKRVLPRSSDTTVAALWASDAQDKIQKVLSPIALAHFGKKNLRSLSKSEIDQIEHLKLCILCGLEPFMEVNEAVIKDLLESQKTPNREFLSVANKKKNYFSDVNNRNPNAQELKSIYSSAFVEVKSF